MSDSGIAVTPKPPYYVVIFTSRRTEEDDGYGATADRMVELARAQRGFLGIESVRGSDGIGITVSYWSDEEAIAGWREHAEHRIAQERGRAVWYDAYMVRVARVSRAHGKGPLVDDDDRR
jgi:heme-degrading monooxygenase HmoA